jgi:choline dehydrogenase-like flavoprotein
MARVGNITVTAGGSSTPSFQAHPNDGRHEMSLNPTIPADGALLEGDLCVVGAGPAGLTLARELAGSPLRVVLLESSSGQDDKGAQSLNEGAVVGDPYAGLDSTRRRQVGGSTGLWNTPVSDAGSGAKYVPLDPIDFQERPGDPLFGWPFGHQALAPYYHRAQGLCGLGPFRYDGKDWSEVDRPILDLGDQLVTRVYQLGNADLWREKYWSDLAPATNITRWVDATATRLVLKGDRVELVEGRTRSGRRFSVRASRFVIAGGAIENARILLCSGEAAHGAPGNHSGWLGRGFMEHPRDTSLTLRPRRPDLARQLTFYDRHRAADGTVIAGRLALSEPLAHRARIPNAYLTLRPRHHVNPWGVTAAALRLGWIASPGGGYGWSAALGREPVPDRIDLLLNLEQRPHRENRVVLGRDRDQLGMPRAELHWRWAVTDQRALDRTREAIISILEEAGLGPIDLRAASRPDPNAHHHAGTTRMHRDPRFGVVDPDSRVHGIENLYLAGASVFPTAGAANPTLTIVAMAIRLADHLKGTGRSPAG